MKKILKVGTRGSKLAMTQTKQAVAVLQGLFPEIEIELVKIKTKGDHLVNHSLQAIGGQGAFVRELELQLREGGIDFAVHSLKDIPTVINDELTIASVPKRRSVNDALLFPKAGLSLADLPKNAIVGTSSLRRKAQLLKVRPDLEIRPIRGNIDTRIRKMMDGEFDAIVLALAGMERLGVDSEVPHQVLDPEMMLPAIGQGALAIECRKADHELVAILQQMQDQATLTAVQAERAFLNSLDGSCTFPVGAYGQTIDGHCTLTGMIGNEDGSLILKETVSGEDPVSVGREVAAKLIQQGADQLIEVCKSDQEKKKDDPLL